MNSFDPPPLESTIQTPVEAADPDPSPSNEELIRSHESRNLFTLALHHIILRVAWIFKTETVIMPAFIDTIAGAGWLRGCLPVLNRVGQSVPSLILSERIRHTPVKKRALFLTSFLMAAPFLILSASWFLLKDKHQTWLPPAFLALYFFFFAVTGLNQLLFGTIQGKLIRPNRRGRLMGLSGTLGAIASITCAWFLLQHWVTLPDGGFEYIFGFTGLGFLVAGVISTFVFEPADPKQQHHKKSKRHFRDAWHAVKEDADFRGLCIVAMLFMTSQMLFPHYQALARKQPGFENVYMMIWVVAQNAGAGIFSPIVGAIADRFGNRMAVRFEFLLAALTPVMAVTLLLNGWFENGIQLYWITFLLLGMVPVTVRTMVNYTLELCEPAKHPQYISILKLSMALPFVFSPFVGYLVDLVGFTTVFYGIALLIALGGLYTFRMTEPRTKLEPK